MSSWLAVVEPDETEEEEEVAADVVTDAEEVEVEGLDFSMNGCWTVYWKNKKNCSHPPLSYWTGR